MNDSVIADPLFTAPVRNGDAHFCYEIRGKPNTIFNLVSDKCTVVNADFMNIPQNGNVIWAVGIRAADSAGNCHNIEEMFADSLNFLKHFFSPPATMKNIMSESVIIQTLSMTLLNLLLYCLLPAMHALHHSILLNYAVISTSEIHHRHGHNHKIIHQSLKSLTYFHYFCIQRSTCYYE